jgi:acyl-coenzyme A thioesterase PaaI-like protein
MTWEIANPTDELFALVLAGMGSAVPFASRVGVVLTSVNDGEATAALPELATALNHVLTVHAGALFTLAETASGAAMAGAFVTVFGEIRPVVSRAEILYPRPAKGPLMARARIDRGAQIVRDELGEKGRVEFVVGVEVLDPSDRTVATFSATWALQRTKSPA